METKKVLASKNVMLATAIATVFLVAMVGSASANGVCVWGDIGAGEYYECGDLVTQSCTFNASMTCPAGGALGILTVQASDVTIDGNGYALIGPGGNVNRYGIHVYNDLDSIGYDNVTIKDMEIRNFRTGINVKGYTDHAEDILIDNCTVHDNGYTGACNSHGIHFANYVCHSNVTNCEVYNNIGKLVDCGCDPGGTGIRIYGLSNNNNITHNKFYNNRGSGIYAKMKSQYNYVAYNDVYENGVSGAEDPTGGIVMRCMLSNNWLIEHNNVSDNYGPGMFIGGSGNTIINNTVTGSKNRPTGDIHIGYGISMGRSDGSYNNELYENTICDNEGADISTCGPECYGNHGDDNTCDMTSYYDDEGTTGCTYACLPDLVIVDKDEDWVVAGSTYTITYTIKNIGNKEANASTTSIKIDGTEEATDSVPELAPGASHTNTLGPFTMSGDSDTIRVCADKDGVVAESDEGNNCLENEFGQTPTPPPGPVGVTEFSPLGLLALIVVLSVALAVTLRRKK